MNQYTLDWAAYRALARTVTAEGCVLLRNSKQALPVYGGETVAVFGRIQLEYYKSGTGSGGMVNVPYVRSLIDGLRDHPDVTVYEPLLSTYQEWIKDHPFDNGIGWGNEPWCQEEMPVTDEIVNDAAAHCDLALIVIGRTAGEDRDNTPTEGSYYLTENEKEMMKKVCSRFSRTAVILNTGNIIDMSWIESYQPSAVLYIWQGGMEGGMGAADVICGKVTPSGKLPDTIAGELSDYPAIRNFGSLKKNLYQEDIYVGYRYFETFAPEKVLFPFGFGLSYTTFSTNASLSLSEDTLLIQASVRNTGLFSGQEVIQIYASAPQGYLGKPSRSLIAYQKTKILQPGETEELTLSISKKELASFDDSGITGYRSCFILEKGTYEIFAGTDVRNAKLIGSFEEKETLLIRQCEEALAPVEAFMRIRPKKESDGRYTIVWEDTPLRKKDLNSCIKKEQQNLSSVSYSGDQGYKLQDVAENKINIETFLAQLTIDDLKHLVNGEGMCSPKVTAGTASAFGGLTNRLFDFGIPIGCCSDGPSGIRMDSGANAFSLPNGTLLAATFHPDLVTHLFEMEGLELYANKIDTLLGPGINIHRCPLNGRNFEYHSEDPYLTGTIAIAQLKGLHKYPVTGTMKHFCANNQELGRHTSDSIISERALREIYLKPFEMGVQSGNARSIMTSYGSVNGIWTAGNYDLNTTILRKEWNYNGIVMTDWWATANDENQKPELTNRAVMVRAQNDLFMVTSDTTTDKNNLDEALKSGQIQRSDLLRNAANICRFLLASPAMERLQGQYHPVNHTNLPDELSISFSEDQSFQSVDDGTILPLNQYTVTNNCSIQIPLLFEKDGTYQFSITLSSDVPAHVQMPMSLSIDNTVKDTIFFQGGSTDPVTSTTLPIPMRGKVHYLKLHFPYGGESLISLKVIKI